MPSSTPATMPGIERGSVTVRKALIGPAPSVIGGSLVVAIDVGQRRGQHDDHDRQRHVDERHDDADLS